MGSSLQKIESRVEKYAVTIMFFLAGLPLLIQSDALFSDISAKDLPWNLSLINERVVAI